MFVSSCLFKLEPQSESLKLIRSFADKELMRSQKSAFFLFCLLCLSMLSRSGFAQERCDQIRNQLIVLEAQIQSSKLPNCALANHRFSCDTFLELQTKYNSLMGKLVIYEGLVSIGHAIENNHNIIKNLKNSQISEASQSVDAFLTNYRKADLINQSMDSNFWITGDNQTYQGESIGDLTSFIADRCSGEGAGLQSFCSNLRAAASEPGVNYSELLLSLSNFALADRHATLSPADREDNYENYKTALELTINGERVSYDSEEVHQEISNINRLKESLGQFKENRSDEKAREILALAKNLETVELNYGVFYQPRPEFREFFNNDLRRGLTSFNQASRALLQKDKIEQNLENLDKLFENSAKSSMLSIEANIKDAANCSGSGEALLQCFEEKCDRGPSGACRQNSENRAFVHKLHSINKQLHSVSAMKEIKNKISPARRCLETPTAQAAQCVADLKSQLGLASQDDVEDARRELHQLELAMERMNNAEDISPLKLSKAMGLMAYKNSGCLASSARLISEEFQATCGSAEIETFSQEAVALTQDMGQILDFSQNPFLNEALNMPSEKFSEYKENFLNHCASSEDANHVLCEMYQNDEAINGEMRENFQRVSRSMIAARSANRRIPAVVSFEGVEEASPASSFFGGLGTSALQRGIPFFIQMDTNKRNHRMMMNYHQNRLSYMQNQYDYLKENPEIPVYYHPYTNYGFSQYDYAASSQFGGSQTAAMFHDPYDFTQFSFPPSAMVDAFGNQSFSSEDSSGGFNFGF